MQKKIAEFLAEVGIVHAFDGIDHFMAFLDEEGSKTGVGLLAVPRAAIGRAEAGDDFLQADDAV
jgi:hypothetical protein